MDRPVRRVRSSRRNLRSSRVADINRNWALGMPMFAAPKIAHRAKKFSLTNALIGAVY